MMMMMVWIREIGIVRRRLFRTANRRRRRHKANNGVVIAVNDRHDQGREIESIRRRRRRIIITATGISSVCVYTRTHISHVCENNQIPEIENVRGGEYTDRVIGK